MTTDKKDHLYHYTTQEGLIGILETNCLWATHYKFLNDYSEIERIKPELIKHISQSKENFSYETDSESFAKYKDYICNASNIVNGWYDYFIMDSDFYVTSFCGEYNYQKYSDDETLNFKKEKFLSEKYINNNGLLSQWRGYGGSGGYAIVFNRNKLEKKFVCKEKINTDEIFIVDVTYSNKEIKSFSDKLSHFLSFANYEINESLYSEMLYQLNPNADKELLSDIMANRNWIGEEQYNAFYNSLMHCVASYKDYGFHEENEVRIFSKLNKKSKKERLFRKKDDEQIPYIKLFDFGKNLPIERIIVGPHKDKNTRAIWLKIKLASMGRDDIEVTVSEIPFVNR